MSYFGPGEDPLELHDALELPYATPINQILSDITGADLEHVGADLSRNEPEISTASHYDEILVRLQAQDEKLEALTKGVNSIGQMMNGVAKAFDDIMTKVNEGGIAGLLGGMMGGKKNA